MDEYKNSLLIPFLDKSLPLLLPLYFYLLWHRIFALMCKYTKYLASRARFKVWCQHPGAVIVAATNLLLKNGDALVF